MRAKGIKNELSFHAEQLTIKPLSWNEFDNCGGVETIILTLPLLDVPAMKSHKGAEIMKPIACKTFGHGIGCHFIGWNILKDDAAIFDAFPDEVVLNIDVFCVRMIFWILGESLIVGVDDVRVGDRDSDLLDKSLDPDRFLRRLS